MLKLYIVIYVAGQTAATIGPLPNQSFCERAAQTQKEIFEDAWVRHDPNDPTWEIDGVKLSHDDYQIECESWSEAPKLGTMPPHT